MLKLTIEQILSSVEILTSAEQEQLVDRLPAILGKNIPTNQHDKQSMINTVDNVRLSGGNAAFNYQPSQAGGDVNVAANFAQQESSEQQELLRALLNLKEAIRNTQDLPELSKIGAETQLAQLATEAQKENPDKTLIERTVSALKQGLQGVKELAGPVITVSAVVAKAWGITV